MTDPTCLPDPCLPPEPTCGPPQARRLGDTPRPVLVVVIVLAAAAMPLTLIAAGMPPTAALSTAAAVTAFALGAAHQLLGLLTAPGRTDGRPVTA